MPSPPPAGLRSGAPITKNIRSSESHSSKFNTGIQSLSFDKMAAKHDLEEELRKFKNPKNLNKSQSSGSFTATGNNFQKSLFVTPEDCVNPQHPERVRHNKLTEFSFLRYETPNSGNWSWNDNINKEDSLGVSHFPRTDMTGTRNIDKPKRPLLASWTEKTQPGSELTKKFFKDIWATEVPSSDGGPGPNGNTNSTIKQTTNKMDYIYTHSESRFKEKLLNQKLSELRSSGKPINRDDYQGSIKDVTHGNERTEAGQEVRLDRSPRSISASAYGFPGTSSSGEQYKEWQKNLLAQKRYGVVSKGLSQIPEPQAMGQFQFEAYMRKRDTHDQLRQILEGRFAGLQGKRFINKRIQEDRIKYEKDRQFAEQFCAKGAEDSFRKKHSRYGLEFEEAATTGIVNLKRKRKPTREQMLGQNIYDENGMRDKSLPAGCSEDWQWQDPYKAGNFWETLKQGGDHNEQYHSKLVYWNQSDQFMLDNFNRDHPNLDIRHSHKTNSTKMTMKTAIEFCGVLLTGNSNNGGAANMDLIVVDREAIYYIQGYQKGLLNLLQNGFHSNQQKLLKLCNLSDVEKIIVHEPPNKKEQQTVFGSDDLNYELNSIRSSGSMAGNNCNSRQAFMLPSAVTLVYRPHGAITQDSERMRILNEYGHKLPSTAGLYLYSSFMNPQNSRHVSNFLHPSYYKAGYSHDLGSVENANQFKFLWPNEVDRGISASSFGGHLLCNRKKNEQNNGGTSGGGINHASLSQDWGMKASRPCYTPKMSSLTKQSQIQLVYNEIKQEEMFMNKLNQMGLLADGDHNHSHFGQGDRRELLANSENNVHHHAGSLYNKFNNNNNDIQLKQSTRPTVLHQLGLTLQEDLVLNNKTKEWVRIPILLDRNGSVALAAIPDDVKFNQDGKQSDLVDSWGIPYSNPRAVPAKEFVEIIDKWHEMGEIVVKNSSSSGWSSSESESKTSMVLDSESEPSSVNNSGSNQVGNSRSNTQDLTQASRYNGTEAAADAAWQTMITDLAASNQQQALKEHTMTVESDERGMDTVVPNTDDNDPSDQQQADSPYTQLLNQTFGLFTMGQTETQSQPQPQVQTQSDVKQKVNEFQEKINQQKLNLQQQQQQQLQQQFHLPHGSFQQTAPVRVSIVVQPNGKPAMIQEIPVDEIKSGESDNNNDQQQQNQIHLSSDDNVTSWMSNFSPVTNMFNDYVLNNSNQDQELKIESEEQVNQNNAQTLQGSEDQDTKNELESKSHYSFREPNLTKSIPVSAMSFDNQRLQAEARATINQTSLRSDAAEQSKSLSDQLQQQGATQDQAITQKSKGTTIRSRSDRKRNILQKMASAHKTMKQSYPEGILNSNGKLIHPAQVQSVKSFMDLHDEVQKKDKKTREMIKKRDKLLQELREIGEGNVNSGAIESGITGKKQSSKNKSSKSNLNKPSEEQIQKLIQKYNNRISPDDSQSGLEVSTRGVSQFFGIDLIDVIISNNQDNADLAIPTQDHVENYKQLLDDDALSLWHNYQRTSELINSNGGLIGLGYGYQGPDTFTQNPLFSKSNYTDNNILPSAFRHLLHPAGTTKSAFYNQDTALNQEMLTSESDRYRLVGHTFSQHLELPGQVSQGKNYYVDKMFRNFNLIPTDPSQAPGQSRGEIDRHLLGTRVKTDSQTHNHDQNFFRANLMELPKFSGHIQGRWVTAPQQQSQNSMTSKPIMKDSERDRDIDNIQRDHEQDFENQLDALQTNHSDEWNALSQVTSFGAGAPSGKQIGNDGSKERNQFFQWLTPDEVKMKKLQKLHENLKSQQQDNVNGSNSVKFSRSLSRVNFASGEHNTEDPQDSIQMDLNSDLSNNYMELLSNHELSSEVGGHNWVGL